MLETQTGTLPVGQGTLNGSLLRGKGRAVVARTIMLAPGALANGAQLLLRKLITCFFREGKELLRGPGGFHRFLLLVCEFTENPLVNNHSLVFLRSADQFSALPVLYNRSAFSTTGLNSSFSVDGWEKL
jgi:hypothetical protein